MNMHRLTLALGAIIAGTTIATAQDLPLYGPPITLEQARKVIAAAEEEAKKQKWPVAITVVDGAGHLVAFARIDNTQYASIEVSLQKAKCAALFRRSTKVFEEGLEKGGMNLRVLSVPHAIPVEGGLPILLEGKVIGGIGVSGVKANEDGVVAAAGLTALAPKTP